MKYNTCPHCYNQVPNGASVCTGCQAEISYGVSIGKLFILFLVITGITLYLLDRNLYLGKALDLLIDSRVLYRVKGMGIILSTFLPGILWVAAIYKRERNSVIFSRRYRR